MLNIRLALRRDASTLAQMSREQIEHGLGWSWTSARLKQRITDQRTNVILAERNKRLAGFAVMEYFDERAHLLLFAVAPDQRRQGVGRAMWAWLKTTALVAGIGTVHLEVRARNTGARDFYRALGFIDAETVRGYYGGVESALRMRARLSVAAHSNGSLPHP